MDSTGSTTYSRLSSAPVVPAALKTSPLECPRAEVETYGRGVGFLCIVITLFGWSSVPLLLKYFARFIDAWTTNGWRYGISAVFWGPFLYLAFRRRSLPADLWRLAIVPSAFNIIAQICFAWAPYFIDPGYLTFLLRFQIVYLALGAYLLFPGERPVLRSKRYWTGVLLVVGGGVGIVLFADRVPKGTTLLGTILALVAGAFYAGYSLSVKHYLGRANPALAFGVISTYTACALVSLMVVFGNRHGVAALDLTGGQFTLLVVSAFVGIAFTHVLYYAALARLGVSVSAGVILLQPVLATVGSYFVFHERLSLLQWVCGLGGVAGGGLIVAAQQRFHGEAPAQGD